MIADALVLLLELAVGVVALTIIGTLVAVGGTLAGLFAFGGFVLMWERAWFKAATIACAVVVGLGLVAMAS